MGAPLAPVPQVALPLDVCQPSNPTGPPSPSGQLLRIKELLFSADDSSQTKAAIVEHSFEGRTEEYRTEFPLHQEQGRSIGPWGNLPLSSGIVFDGDVVVPVYEHSRLDVYVLDTGACAIKYGYSVYLSSGDRHGLSSGMAEHNGDLVVGVHELSGLTSTHAEQLARCEPSGAHSADDRCAFGFGTGSLVRLRHVGTAGRLQAIAQHATATEQPYGFFFAKGELYLVNAGCHRFPTEPAPGCLSSIQKVLGSGLGPPTMLPAGVQAGQAHVVEAAPTADRGESAAYRIVISEMFGSVVVTLEPHDETDSTGTFDVLDVLRFDGRAWRNHTAEAVRQGWNEPLVVGGITEWASMLEPSASNSTFRRHRRAFSPDTAPFAAFEVIVATSPYAPAPTGIDLPNVVVPPMLFR